MNVEDFATTIYVRRPFEVRAFEITRDNITELAPHVGELCDDDGTPFIKSDKKKVGNNFRVWPGFFATVLKGHVRCYSRKSFFEQFAELNDKTSPVVEFLHGRATFDEMLDVLNPTDAVGEPDQEEAPEVEVVVEIDLEGVELLDANETIAETGSFPEEKAATCAHGTPADRDCAYRPCDGIETDEDAEATDVEAHDASNDARDLSGWMGTDEEIAARYNGADLDNTLDPIEPSSILATYKAGLDSVIRG